MRVKVRPMQTKTTETLIICRADEVEEQAAASGATAVLSIEHPGATAGKGRAPRLKGNGIAQDILTFWDIEDETAQDGPSEDVLRRAFDFLHAHEDETVIIHCNAGKARSAAIALAWMAYNNGVTDAVDQLKAIRPQAAPNLAVIRLADKMLKFDGELTKAVENDADFTANRKQADAARARQLRKNPELWDKLFPEKPRPF